MPKKKKSEIGTLIVIDPTEQFVEFVRGKYAPYFKLGLDEYGRPTILVVWGYTLGQYKRVVGLDAFLCPDCYRPG